MKVFIRRANIDDLLSVNKIAKQVQNLHVKIRPDIYLPNDNVISEERFKELLEQEIVVVGEIEHQIVSYAVCILKTWNNPLIKNRKVMFIDTVGNDEKYIKCGIGKQMMNYIINLAKQKKCNSIELQVNSKNKNAIDFYQHLGMSEKTKILEMDLK